jgi:hypothetical protein
MEPHQPPHVLVRQEVLNMHWPPKPAELRTGEPAIPVRVRIVWKRDGEEYMEGMATRWDADHVYVEVRDKRLQGNGLWVKPCDVYRRSPEPMPGTALRSQRTDSG